MSQRQTAIRWLMAVLAAAWPCWLAGCDYSAAPSHDPYARHVNEALGRAVGPVRVVSAAPAPVAEADAPPVVLAAWAGVDAPPLTGLAQPTAADVAGELLAQPLNASPLIEPAAGLARSNSRLALSPPATMIAAAADASPPAGSTRTAGPMDRLARDAGPLDSFTDTLMRDLKAAPSELWRDTRNVATVNNALLLLAAGGASAMSRWMDADQSLDTTVARHFDRHHAMPRDWNEAFGFAGNPAAHFGLAAVAYAYSTLAKDAKTYDVSKTLMSALIINGVATMTLKAAVADDRGPNGEHFAWPSGHTSSAFTTAAVLEVAYGWKVGAPAYGVAALAALQRLDTREHWLSDVIFGAAMGIAIGRSVAKGRLMEVNGWTVLPYAQPGGGGVMLVKQQ